MEGYSSHMSIVLIFCRSPHVAGTIGEVCREVAAGIMSMGMEPIFVSSCEPISYIEPVDGIGYPVSVDGKILACFCSPDNTIIALYEHIINYKPSHIFSIGERVEMELASAALQVAGISVLHYHLWIGSSSPSSSVLESSGRTDAIMCFGKSTALSFKNHAKRVVATEVRRHGDIEPRYRSRGMVAMTGGPSNDSANLLCVADALSGSSILVNFVTNLYEQGDYDVRTFCESMNVNASYGEEPLGTFYGLDNDAAMKIAHYSDIVIDMSIKQASCLAVDSCVRAGCLPILCRTPRHMEFLTVRGLAKEHIDAITVPCAQFRPGGGDCIWIADPEILKEKLNSAKVISVVDSIIRTLGCGSDSLPTLRQEIYKIF